MIQFQEALVKVYGQGKKRASSFLDQSECVPLNESSGRITAEAVHGRETVPGFDNSSMDGFAVRSEESLGASPSQPITLGVQETILAGQTPIVVPDTRARRCYEIMTGAPVPTGFDAIYKVEDIEVILDSERKLRSIRIAKPIRRFENFRARGADFEAGAKLLVANTRLMPEQVMALASVGVSEVRVLRKPKVAVLSTGSELVSPEEPSLLPGKIRNSTASYLQSAIPHFGAEVRYYGTVTDDRSVFIGMLERILGDRPDVILTTGAVSKGTHDFIPEIIQGMRAEILFHNVAIRPGKPQLFAQFPENGPAFFGIPGNPVSTAVGLRFFVNAYLRGLTGLEAERPLTGLLAKSVEKPNGLLCLFKAHAEISSRGTRITSLTGQPSFMVSSLIRANAWVELEKDLDLVQEGSRVAFYPLFPSHYDYSRPFNASEITDAESCC